MTYRINQDELNCPACDKKPIMEVFGWFSSRVADGWSVECPSCGFCINGPDAWTVEQAVRTLWDYMPEKESFTPDEDCFR